LAAPQPQLAIFLSTAQSAALRVCIVFRYQLKLRKGRLLENVNTLKTQFFLNAPF
jgi:hypothetical protein